MPIIGPQLAANIRACSPNTGVGWVMLTEGVGLGVQNWINANPMNLLMVGSTNGLAGAGMVSGKMFCPPAPPLVIGACTGAGMTGIMTSALATSVAIGLSNTINQTGFYMGPSAGVSGGADISKVVVSNAGSLIPMILGGMASVGMTGVTLPILATGLGNGIALNIALAFGTGIVAPVAPAPSAASGASPTSFVV